MYFVVCSLFNYGNLYRNLSTCYSLVKVAQRYKLYEISDFRHSFAGVFVLLGCKVA